MKCTYCDKKSGTFPINVTTADGSLSICGKCIKKWFDCMEEFETLKEIVKLISDNAKIG